MHWNIFPPKLEVVCDNGSWKWNWEAWISCVHFFNEELRWFGVMTGEWMGHVIQWKWHMPMNRWKHIESVDEKCIHSSDWGRERTNSCYHPGNKKRNLKRLVLNKFTLLYFSLTTRKIKRKDMNSRQQLSGQMINIHFDWWDFLRGWNENRIKTMKKRYFWNKNSEVPFEFHKNKYTFQS